MSTPPQKRMIYTRSFGALAALPFLFLPFLLPMIGAKPPNVILILADDLGIGGLGSYGSDWLETPRIDQLGREGMKFTHGLSPYPTCQPSRAAILSGQYGPRTGAYRVSQHHLGNEHLIKYQVPPKRNLDHEKITLAESFQRAGYTTAMYGKWHVSNYGDGHPHYHGFDEAIAGTGHYQVKSVPEIDLPEGVSAAEFFTDKARDFIKNAHAKNQPFFLYMPYYLVHRPLEAKAAYVAHFREKMKDFESKHPDPDEVPVIAAMHKMLDDAVGALLDEVSALGIEEDTVIVFTSDNGAYSFDYTGETRGRKGDTYDGGLRVPYIFKWPGEIPAGSVSAERITGVDLYPTLLGISGVDNPNFYVLDGVDISSLLRGELTSLSDRAVFCYYPKYAQYREETKRWIYSWRNVIYKGDYKLIEYPEYDEIELFHLGRDPLESENLTEKFPSKREELMRELHDWLEKIEAPKLQLNPDYILGSDRS
ncbi:MAG: sulfatase [Opitutaceae bacterium]|jgi:arylsulfatase A-like enzyme|nr:sulfatase [Opitutaceae bacterium]